jgi:hypothetical protein
MSIMYAIIFPPTHSQAQKHRVLLATTLIENPENKNLNLTKKAQSEKAHCYFTAFCFEVRNIAATRESLGIYKDNVV